METLTWLEGGKCSHWVNGCLQPELFSSVMILLNCPLIVIDLKDCFFTLPLHSDDVPCFAFSVPTLNHAEPMKTYNWTVFPQGMCNIPTRVESGRPYSATCVPPVSWGNHIPLHGWYFTCSWRPLCSIQVAHSGNSSSWISHCTREKAAASPVALPWVENHSANYLPWACKALC